MIKFLIALSLTAAQYPPPGTYVRPAAPVAAAEPLPREIQDQVDDMPARSKAEADADDPTLPPEIKENVDNMPKANASAPATSDDDDAPKPSPSPKPKKHRRPKIAASFLNTGESPAPGTPASDAASTDSASPSAAPLDPVAARKAAIAAKVKALKKRRAAAKKKAALASASPAPGAAPGVNQRQKPGFAQAAAADAEEADRLSRQSETEALDRQRKNKLHHKKSTSTQLLAPNGAVNPSDPIPDPSASPAAGTKKSRHKKGKQYAALPPGTAAATAAGADDEGSGSKHGYHRRDDQYARTGEEAPIATSSAERGQANVVRTGPPVAATLTEILEGLVDHPRMPTERDLGFTYLGYIGDKSRQKELSGLINDPKVDDAEKLPLLAALVDAYGDNSHTSELTRVVDSPHSIPFQKLWALEILGRAGDHSRVSVLQAIAHDHNADQSDRLRALTILADQGESSAKNEAKQLSADESLFLATRMSALAILARMEKGTGTSELVSRMKKPKLSIGERLTIALDLCRLGDPSARPFFERVVEQESDSIFDQLRALHGLALLGLTEYVPLLQRVIETRARPRAAAERVMVLMGDRSRIPALLGVAKQGDLEALKTLTLVQLMDANKLTAPQLYHEPRYRTLIGQ